jgi:hypothetical protein
MLNLLIFETGDETSTTDSELYSYYGSDNSSSNPVQIRKGPCIDPYKDPVRPSGFLLFSTAFCLLLFHLF